MRAACRLLKWPNPGARTVSVESSRNTSSLWSREGRAFYTKGTAKVTTERKEKITVGAFSVLLLP